MRSIFLRRLLIAVTVAMIVALAFMLAGYVVLSRDIYAKIKLEELMPKAAAMEQLTIEFLSGEVTSGAFDRMTGKLMRAANACTLIVDGESRVVKFTSNLPELTEGDILKSLGPFIDDILNGNTVSQGNIEIEGHGSALLVGRPIILSGGNVAGGVLVVKSIEDVIDATRRMTGMLSWLILAMVPVIILATTFGVRRITDPLHSMSEAAIEMSKGNFSIRVGEDEKGEVGVLARALNNLCETLSHTIYQLSAEKGQLDRILQSLGDGVAAIDSAGCITHYNGALMRMFGAVNVETREQLISDPAIWRAFDAVNESGQLQSITYSMPNDKMIWITIAPVVTDLGKRIGVVGLFKDMTEMERLESLRREYVANVSHELRTPLTAIRGLLEPLVDGMVPDEADKQRYYKVMLHEVMRLSRLITDMMTISRLQSGAEYMELSRVDLYDLISDIVGGYTAAAQQKGISLIVDAPERVPDALTDPDRIEQVLVILIDNAIRYTPDGGSITIGLRFDKRIIITVTDTGCGIPENDLPHIFERFYKVDKSRGEGGTGLGLSIAKFIMDKLGERIEVESVVDEGTRFTLTVKQYVRNAIALGPAGEGKSRYGDDVAFDAVHPPEDDGKRIVDAPYEVISSSKKPTPPRKRERS